MGPSQSKAKEQVDISINHPKFNNAKFIPTGNKRNIEVSMGADEKDYNKWKETLEKQKPQSQYLLLPIKHDFSSKGLCGSSGTLHLQFEDFPYLLTEQIYHRKGRKSQFEEQELWYLLYCLCVGKNSMRPVGSKLGDIRPANIFINDEGAVKVANQLSWPKATTNYGLAFENQPTYLAPEELKSLELGKIQSNNHPLAETYSMGLTLLSAVALEDLQSLYDLKNYRLNYGSLDEKLHEFKLNRAYSDIFKATVSNMLSIDELARISDQELLDWIRPHEQSILARQNFIFESAPQKIDIEFNLLRKLVSSILVQGTPIQGSFPNITQSPSNGPIIGHPREVRSSFSGQKLNFPPPQIRTNYLNEVPSPGRNSNINQAESMYVPASGRVSDGEIKRSDEQRQQKGGNEEGSPTK